MYLFLTSERWQALADWTRDLDWKLLNPRQDPLGQKSEIRESFEMQPRRGSLLFGVATLGGRAEVKEGQQVKPNHFSAFHPKYVSIERVCFNGSTVAHSELFPRNHGRLSQNKQKPPFPLCTANISPNPSDSLHADHRIIMNSPNNWSRGLCL
jgi:hypothetical protein